MTLSLNAFFIAFLSLYASMALDVKNATLSRTLTLVLLIWCAVQFLKTKKSPFSPIFFAVSGYTLICGISTFYAYSGKFAINEFVKILIAFSIFVFITCKEKIDTRQILCWISSGGAFLSFVTLENTTIGLFTPWLMRTFYGGIVTNHAVFDGDRFTSLFDNSNVFATILGITLFITMYLYKTEKNFSNKITQGICLIGISYSFLMAFSMGGTACFAVSCLIYILFSTNEERFENLSIILQALAFSFLAVILSSSTFIAHAPSGNILPLFLIGLFGILFVYLDTHVLIKIKAILAQKHKLVLVTILSSLVSGVIALVLAVNVTGSLELASNSSFKRVVYPVSSETTLQVESDDLYNLNILIYTRTNSDIYMDNDVFLVSGNASDFPSFNISSDVEEVKIIVENLSDETISIDKISFISESGDETDVKLNYLFLPYNIEQRIQGLSTNYSAMTRVWYAKDGIKLFAQNPIFGYGLGGFENTVQTVQSYHYETKYAHNHFVQTLVDSGIIGFALFVITLILCCVALIENRKNVLAQTLLACICMIILHGGYDLSLSAVECIPFVFAIFAIISLEFSNKMEKKPTILNILFILPIFAFSIFFSGNIYANYRRNASSVTSNVMSTLAFVDIFEKNDFMLSYVMSNKSTTDKDRLEKIDSYLEKLENSRSNTVSLILGTYFIEKSDYQRAIDNFENYIYLAKYDPENWNTFFNSIIDTLYSEENYEHFTEFKQDYIDFILKMRAVVDELNEDSLSKIELDVEIQNKIAEISRGN